MRPSGTEPKIKFYFFVQAPVDEDAGGRINQGERLRQAAQSALEAWLAG
jgi:phosphomannomutase